MCSIIATAKITIANGVEFLALAKVLERRSRILYRITVSEKLTNTEGVRE
jgi:hypothetical protein